MGCNSSAEQVMPQGQVLPQHGNPENNSIPNIKSQPQPQKKEELNPQPQAMEHKAPSQDKRVEQARLALSLREEAKKKDKILEQQLQKHVNNLFDQYDINKRGYLNSIQFSKLLKEQMQTDVSREEVKEYLKIADLSGDKKIDKKELLTLYRTLIKY